MLATRDPVQPGIRIVPFLVLFSLSACNWGYGAPVDRSKFGSAALHEDGVRCVFALHDVVYRPAEGLRAFPDGGVPDYELDRHKLGIVDVDTAEVTVLVDEENRDWLGGHGGYHVTGVRGRSALIGQSGQRRDYEQHREWFRLDLARGDLERLPLDDEFAKEGRELGRVAVVDDDFTLILVTKKGDAPQEIWARDAGGALRRLAATEHYYGAAEGQIWWYDVSARAGARTDYRTGTTIRERRANFAMPRAEPTSKCAARFDGSALLYQDEADGTWRERPLDIAASALR